MSGTGSMVEIQVQEVSGNWRTVGITENQDQLVKVRLDEAVRSYGKRARAIMQGSRAVLDIRG